MSYRPSFSAGPVLLGVLLTLLCFMAAGRDLWPRVLLASLVVPTGVRTFLVLRRRHADEGVVYSQNALGVLIMSAVRTVALGVWLIFVIVFTDFLKSSDEGRLVVIPVLLGGLVVWLVLLWRARGRDHIEAHVITKLDWRRLWRVRFTTRGMLVAVALVALPLWPMHNLLMQPIYRALASNEAFMAELCLAESRLMADRAKQCRGRAARGAAWNLEDETSEGLKDCPYATDHPGRSWLEQAEIWDRGAERSRLGAQRHLAKSESY